MATANDDGRIDDVGAEEDSDDEDFDTCWYDEERVHVNLCHYTRFGQQSWLQLKRNDPNLRWVHMAWNDPFVRTIDRKNLAKINM